MPVQDESAIHARVDGFQKFKKFLVAECGGFPEISGKRPETPAMTPGKLAIFRMNFRVLPAVFRAD